MSYWYLNVVSPSWGAFVWGNYEAAFPLTITKKAGVEQYIQPIFTREFKLLGKQDETVDVISILEESFKNINLRLDDKHSIYKSVERTHQFIDLKIDYKSNYSTNAKRLIKKANKQFSYSEVTELDPFLDLIASTLMRKIDEFNKENIAKLSALMHAARAEKKGKAIGVFDSNGMFLGAGFFFLHQNRITYLKGTAVESAKRNGAMYGLIDFALSLFEKDYDVFDFGGSDIENVANFYHKFGAQDRIYYHYEINNMPIWYRLLKTVWSWK